ncbi:MULTISPECIES: GNAT family N-acetyltransferase [Clostridium]|uniref:GNAT family N-acetyltransferase n=1 Tax=Clostridium TaxID=1485 RepID=UPI000826A682|nr:MULTISPECIES: GNAT family N-acetyltransferase [Clostridium]PJI07506.1 N-acetyltransferase [Clostridium sp. CT7]
MSKFKGGDMIVGLTNLPHYEVTNKNIKLKRAFPGDKEEILNFVHENFQTNWTYEVEQSLMQSPGKCFIATEKGKLLGFACYDASAKGFFGPIGVLTSERGKNIGTLLLLRTLESMREYGYGYAIIGWVSEAEQFYRKTVSAEYIKNGEPENSVYSNLIFMK